MAARPDDSGAAGYRLVHRLDPGGVRTPVTSVALSRGAVLAATGDADGSARVWNVATGLRQGPVLTVRGAQRGAQRVLALAFSPDGVILATGCANGTTYLWNTATGRLTATLPDPGAKGNVESVAFSPAGGTLAAGSANGSTYLWNVTPGRPGSLAATRHDPSGEGIGSVAFSGGGLLATGDNGGSIYLWKVASRDPSGLVVMPGGGAVTALAFSGNGKLLAIGDADGSSRVWNFGSQHGQQISGTRAPVRALALTASGKLAIVEGGGLTYRWQSRAAGATVSATGTLTDPATGAADASSVAFSGDGRWLVTGDPSGSAQIWESRS